MGATTDYISKDQVRALAPRSDLWGVYLIAHVWGVVIASVAMFVIWPNALTFILAFALIAARQHGMAILMHDAAHRSLFKSKRLNDFAGQYLLASAYGADLHSYRKYHLKHHRFAQSDDDPDLPLAAKYPLSRASITRKLLRDIFGLTYLRIRIAQFKTNRGGHKIDGLDSFEKQSSLPSLMVNLIIFAVFWAAGHPWLYLTLWVLPLFTLFFAIIRIRNIAEHALTTRDDNPLTHARTTKANMLARIFLAPYWVNYHVEHHAYMYVPCYRLKALHAQMGRAGYHSQMEIKPNYMSVIKLAIVPTA